MLGTFFYSIFNDAKNKHSTKLLVQKGIIMMGIPRDRAMKCIMKQKWIFNLDCETIKTYFIWRAVLFKSHSDSNRRANVNVVLYHLWCTKTWLLFSPYIHHTNRSMGINVRFYPRWRDLYISITHHNHIIQTV